jgi:hypothetical protein
VHSFDANTVALWRLDEEVVKPVSYADVGSVYTLTPSITPLSLIYGRFGAARFNRSNAFASGAADATARAAARGDWTVEFFVQPFKSPLDWGCEYILSLGHDWDSEDDNILFAISLLQNEFLGTSSSNSDTNYPETEASLIRRIRCEWLYGSSPDSIAVETPVGIGIPVDANWYHVAIRKSNSGTKLEVFINGVLKSIFTGLTNTTGGITANWCLFGGAHLPSDVSAQFRGMLDDIRFSNIARTNNEIAADAEIRSLNSFVINPWGSGGPTPPPTPTPPVVGSFNPAPGTSITASTPLEFSVTDNSGLFTRIILIADFRAFGIREIIHDGYAFGPNYRGPHNIITSITNGFRYSALRTGGWPESPTIQPFAIDREGTENL